MTPTKLREGPYRFFFFANEGNEPPHIHVARDDDEAKFWLAPVALAASGGFRAHELRTIQRIVEDNRDYLLEQWDEFYGR